jgi:hypothetical protein
MDSSLTRSSSTMGAPGKLQGRLCRRSVPGRARHNASKTPVNALYPGHTVPPARSNPGGGTSRRSAVCSAESVRRLAGYGFQFLRFRNCLAGAGVLLEVGRATGDRAIGDQDGPLHGQSAVGVRLIVHLRAGPVRIAGDAIIAPANRTGLAHDAGRRHLVAGRNVPAKSAPIGQPRVAMAIPRPPRGLSALNGEVIVVVLQCHRFRRAARGQSKGFGVRISAFNVAFFLGGPLGLPTLGACSKLAAFWGTAVPITTCREGSA